MLSLFKEKLQSVQDGITLSLKGGERADRSTEDLNAGSRLLAKYQAEWEDLHRQSEENASKAVVVDRQIEACHDIVKRRRFSLRKFNTEAGDLPRIIVLAEKAVNAIGNIRTMIDEIQESIISVEDLIEAEEHLEHMAGSTERLQEYRKEQLISLDALRERLAEDYEEKLKKFDQHNEEIRQKNYQIAEENFLRDLSTYKETGELPKLEPVEQSVSIEDIVIEQDPAALQEFHLS